MLVLIFDVIIGPNASKGIIEPSLPPLLPEPLAVTASRDERSFFRSGFRAFRPGSAFPKVKRRTCDRSRTLSLAIQKLIFETVPSRFPITTLRAYRATRVALRATTKPPWLGTNLSAMPKVATGFYAVCKGREIGVFTTWYVSVSVFEQ